MLAVGWDYTEQNIELKVHKVALSDAEKSTKV